MAPSNDHRNKYRIPTHPGFFTSATQLIKFVVINLPLNVFINNCHSQMEAVVSSLDHWFCNYSETSAHIVRFFLNIRLTTVLTQIAAGNPWLSLADTVIHMPSPFDEASSKRGYEVQEFQKKKKDTGKGPPRL